MKKLFIFIVSFLLLSFVPVAKQVLPELSNNSNFSDTTLVPLKDSIIFLDSTKIDSLVSKQNAEFELSDKKKEKDSEATYSGTGDFYKGMASFYASKFDGRKTATGEIFRNSGMTAASNTFRLNTWVKVTNTRNGKVVYVKVNDRMAPSMHKKGRILDLTQAAARKLDFYNAGTTSVKVEIVNKDSVSR